MSADDEQGRDYRVGFGRTPEHTRYKVGQKSANPKGRPKTASHNVAELLKTELSTKVEVQEGGRHRKVTKAEAAVKLLVKEALKGKLPAIDRIMRILPHLSELPSEPGDSKEGFETGGLSLSTLEALQRAIDQKIKALKLSEQTSANADQQDRAAEGHAEKDQNNE